MQRRSLLLKTQLLQLRKETLKLKFERYNQLNSRELTNWELVIIQLADSQYTPERLK